MNENAAKAAADAARSINQQARLDLLGQDEWWVTNTGWHTLLATYTATREVIVDTDASGRPLAVARTVTQPAYHCIADRLAAVTEEDRAKVRLSDMTVGHRQGVLNLLWRAAGGVFQYHYWHLGAGAPDYDDVQHSIQLEADRIVGCFQDSDQLRAWFDELPFVRACRTLNEAAKERRLVGAVLFG